jgi:RNA polymerase sigma-B factor
MIDDPERPADDENALFARYAATKDRALRNRVVERYMGLAVHIAKRYSRAGLAEDVRQAAMIGLVKAVDRFDPELGTPFGTFAGTTIEGELKRFLRDQTWVVRVPRSAKELHLAVQKATAQLQQELGRSPTVADLTTRLGLSRDDVLRGLAAGAAYAVDTLDADMGGAASSGVADRRTATEERGFDHALDAHTVAALLDELPEREREIVRLRFFDELSQSQIAERMGLSQMHVSRLLKRSFELLRARLGHE